MARPLKNKKDQELLADQEKIKCIDCGKEFEVDAKNTKTCRCEKCQEIENKKNKREYWRKNKN